MAMKVSDSHQRLQPLFNGRKKKANWGGKNPTYLAVVSNHLKNISQIGNLPQIAVKIKICETTT